MKELLKGEIGQEGMYGLKIEDGMIKAEVGYKLEVLLAPLKDKVIDKIKTAIPGELDDMVLDRAWAALMEAVAE
jgi:hypothetical protein